MVKQKKHIRTSKRGKRFVAGSKIDSVPVSIKKQIINAHIEDLKKELKTEGRARIPDLGIFKIKVKSARKAKMGMNPLTGKKMMFKARPKMNLVRFRPSKELAEMVA